MKFWIQSTAILLSVFLSASGSAAQGIIVDHTCTDLAAIPQAAIQAAKDDLHIAYGHTSHGSQVTSGMDGLVDFANQGGLGLSLPEDIFDWNNGGSDGALDLHDYAMGGDVGYYPQWVGNTRQYLDDPAHADVNVIIWSWCGQVDDKYAAGTLDQEYLSPMSQLEADYPGVSFIYMTGHVDIWDDADNKAANQMIREYCRNNHKILYDFADIERYDPDGNYYEYVSDNCDYYDGPGGSRLGNWASEWQVSHVEGRDWYTCSSAHSQPLNANQKAYAAWWLWARLAGWEPGAPGNRPPVLQPVSDQSVNEGELLQFIIQATDPDGDQLRFSASNLPPGATFDEAGAAFSWMPGYDQAGVYAAVSFRVVDDGDPPMSSTTTVSINVTEDNRRPGAPVLTRPMNGESDVRINPTLSAQAFQDPDDGDMHARTRWQISRYPDFSSLVFDLESADHLTTLDIPAALLPGATVYYWRVRFFDQHLRASAWSPVFSFSTLTDDIDGNGVPDDQEALDALMDLDGDGQPDGSQTGARCLDMVTGHGSITLKAGDNVRMIDTLMSVAVETIALTEALPGRFPQGLIGFRVETMAVGDEASVTVYFSEPLDADTIWYKLDTDGWQDYSQHASIAADRRSVTLHVRDGGHGDADGVANGIVVDPSGPAILSSSANPSASTGGGGGCYIDMLMIP
jgi:hypothetical protein